MRGSKTKQISRKEKAFLRALGRRIGDLRHEKGLSQVELAAAAQLHRNYVGDIERGERNIHIVSLTRIAEALEMELPELLTVPKE
jgi:transcriptional regulator with XRE-family HTH domain